MEKKFIRIRFAMRCVLLTEIEIIGLLVFDILDLLFQGADETMK